MTAAPDLLLLRAIASHVGPNKAEALSDFEFARLTSALREIKSGNSLSPQRRDFYQRVAERIGVRA